MARPDMILIAAESAVNNPIKSTQAEALSNIP